MPAIDRCRIEKDIPGVVAQVGAKPIVNGQPETSLRRIQDLVGNPAARRVLQPDLVGMAAELVAGGQRRGELHELVVEQRRAPLQRVRHGGDVDLRQQIVGKVGRVSTSSMRSTMSVAVDWRQGALMTSRTASSDERPAVLVGIELVAVEPVSRDMYAA